MINTVIFDMDGVIVDSELYWKKTESSLLKNLVPAWNEKEHKKIIGRSVYDIYIFLKERYNLKVEKEEFLKQYNETAIKIYKEKASMLPGCLEFIKKLKESGFKLAIASSSPMTWIDIVVKKFNLNSFFDEIISADEVGCKGKPAPEIYIYAAKKLKLEPKGCVVIEDSENGVISAKEAGMKCIGIRNGFNDKQDISRADLIINGFKEINLEIIDNL